MHVSQVDLTNFRNYRHLQVALAPGTTILYGANAVGKSSFLEALTMLATTRSPRASAEREVIHWDAAMELGIAPFARIAGRVQRADGPLTVELVVQRTVDNEGQVTGRCQKRFLVNRRQVRARDAAGRLQVVLFEPEDLNLITGSPTRRRRYLDMTLVQADRHYAQALGRYTRVVVQRNGLLHRWHDATVPASAREQMAFWNREIVQNGAYLMVARHRLVTTLNPLLEEMHGRLAGTAPPFRLTYLHQVDCNPDQDEESVAYAFRQALTQAWPREIERGVTLLGPHRDDLAFHLGEMDMTTYGSRGQQRTATLSLKLAQVAWLREQSGETPVVLLDDVLSELDPERRGYLQGWLLQGGCQVVVTATDLGDFMPIVLEQAEVYRLEGGLWGKEG
jgi:DNA replication and repair protein RecF